MSSTSYSPFLPLPLTVVVNSKAFIPFQLAMTDAGSVSAASLVASKHQQHADLLTLPATTTVANALDFFRKYDITAVPLTTSDSNSGGKTVRFKESINHEIEPSKVIGVLGVHDIVGAVVASLTESMTEAEIQSLPVWNTNVATIITANDSNRDVWFLSSNHTVRDAARSLSAGFRHILVYEVSPNTLARSDSAKVKVTIVSAGDLMRFCYTSIPSSDADTSDTPPALLTLLNSSIDSHLQPRKLLTFNENDLTLNAFRTLSEGVANKSLGAIPIISHDGHVVDNLSASDIRVIDPSNAIKLLRPLKSFLPALRSNPSTPRTESASSPKSAAALRPPFAASILTTSTVRMTLEKLTVLGISRLWVIDHIARPINVVSLSDIFSLFANLNLNENAHRQ